MGIRLPPHTVGLGYQKAEIECLGHKAGQGQTMGELTLALLEGLTEGSDSSLLSLPWDKQEGYSRGNEVSCGEVF